MTNSGDGGADDWGWGVPADSAPDADNASTTEFPPQATQHPPHQQFGAYPGVPQDNSAETGKRRPKWVPILALLIIIPVGIAAAFFGVNALRDSGGGDGSTGLIVDGAGSGGQGGSGDGPSPSGTVKDDSERLHFHTGDIGNSDLDPIQSEPFFSGDTNPENVRTMADREYLGRNMFQEDMNGSADSTSYEIRIGIDGDDGWVEYPTLGCSGTLRYTGTQGGTVVYEEVITSGTQNCADTGTWWFRVIDESKSTVGGFYESSDGRWRVSGGFYDD